jgi:putative ABC transport system substrate-binding protein
MLETTSEAQNSANMTAFRQSLSSLGYAEHQNYTIDYRSADGRSERFGSLVAELLKLGVDILVARGTPATLAAREASATIPIVMTSTADPFAIVQSIARPGGNVTGMSSLIADLGSKRLELLSDFLPRLAKVAVVTDGRNPTLSTSNRAVEAAAQALKIEVVKFDVRKTDDLRPAFAAASTQRVDAVAMATETSTQANRQLITELAAEYRIPVIYSSREFVDAGGLISFGVNYQDMYRRAAIYVDKIFKGAKPADLPIEQPSTFELVVNLKAAKALGIAVPPTLIARADEVIE